MKILKDKNVLIIGPPASGKTTLAEKLFKEKYWHKLIHTDDYMKYGYEGALYVLIDDLQGRYKGMLTLIEGVQGYRLLRKGVQLGIYFPNTVIEMQIDSARREEIYRLERDPKKLKYLKSFDSMHEKILNDYFELIGNARPEWIKMKIQ